MIETINFNGKDYPKFQSEGFASKFAIPFAKEVCKGIGYDIGCGKAEWALPGSIPVDFNIDGCKYDATNLPNEKVDYIFSSHCAEHVIFWVQMFEYWTNHLKSGGVLFLYLPHYNQEYWRPWNNRKHVNIFTPEIIKDYLLNNGYVNVFVSERDLNDSFMAMGEKI